jgi:hypothetical protein
MKFERVLREALPAPVATEVALSSKYSGTNDATKVDWSSRPGGPQTNLGKLAMKKKQKKAKSYSSRMN